MPERETRRSLFRWLGWFAAANSLVLLLASIRYISAGADSPVTPLALMYVSSAYISHLALLSALPLFVLLAPLIIVWPRKPLVMGTGITVMALMVAFLTLDSLLWAQSRFHLNLFTAQILGAPSWIFSSVMFLIALVFESFLARSTWLWLERRRSAGGRMLGALLGIALLVSQVIHAWADATFHTPVTASAVNLPGYRGITAKSLFDDLGLVDVKYSRERNLARRMSGQLGHERYSALNYPLAPLQCTGQSGLNLLIIVVDSMRSDSLDPSVTPNIHDLAEKNAVRFNRHYSGGNSSMIGLFSIFYGLAPGYFEAIKSAQQASVLVTEIQSWGYQVGIHSSSSLTRPAALDGTAFATVPGLESAVPSHELPHTRRVEVTNAQWLEWIATVDPGRPFFSFIYYDSSRKALPGESPPKVRDAMEREFLEYEEAMRANDALVGSVLADLSSREILDKTVVLITSDHGEQFGEFDRNVVGHGSAYSREQMQVPLVIHWPGMEPRSIGVRTSHYDIVPTLMQRLLGCSNPASDFSSGQDLFTRDSWEWLLAGSYYNYAVLEPDQITITFPNGRYEVRDWNYSLLPDPVFRAEVMQEIIRGQLLIRNRNLGRVE